MKAQIVSLTTFAAGIALGGAGMQAVQNPAKSVERTIERRLDCNDGNPVSIESIDVAQESLLTGVGVPASGKWSVVYSKGTAHGRARRIDRLGKTQPKVTPLGPIDVSAVVPDQSQRWSVTYAGNGARARRIVWGCRWVDVLSAPLPATMADAPEVGEDI